MKYAHAWVFAVAALLCACGGNTSTAPSTFLDSANGKLSAQSVGADTIRFGTRNSDPCGDTTYVGPLRPISVHGTTFYVSWLGSDNDVRGYEVQWQLDVANVYVDSGSTVVPLPEAHIHVRTEGTYRFRVRGLFCEGQEGPWTDWQVKGTDDTEDHSPTPPPVLCPSSVDGCYPPPPPPDDDCEHDHNHDGHCDNGDNGGGHDDNDDHGGGGNDNPPPPIDPPTTFCHVSVTGGRGGPHFHYQTLTLPLSAVQNGHIPQHEYDHYGSCNND